jgi:hypothetical protein
MLTSFNHKHSASLYRMWRSLGSFTQKLLRSSQRSSLKLVPSATDLRTNEDTEEVILTYVRVKYLEEQNKNRKNFHGSHYSNPE